MIQKARLLDALATRSGSVIYEAILAIQDQGLQMQILNDYVCLVQILRADQDLILDENLRYLPSMSDQRIREEEFETYSSPEAWKTIPWDMIEVLSLKASISIHSKIDNSRLASSLYLLPSLEYLTLTNQEILDTDLLFKEVKKLVQITLQNCNIVTIGESISGLLHLEVMDLSGNKINFMPESMMSLKLKELNLSDNRLESFPFWLSEMPSLHNLQLRKNGLKGGLPRHFCEKSNVEQLDLNDNSLADISAVSTFESLISLRIANNPISEFPRNLGNIAYLEMDADQFSGISRSIKYNPQLKGLTISGGQSKVDLRELEELLSLEELMLKDIDLEIGNLSRFPKLRLLSVVGCKVPDGLPQGLFDLFDLRQLVWVGGQIPNLDGDWSKLPHLWNLNLAQCEISNFHDSLLRQSSISSLTLSGNNLSPAQQAMIKLSFPNAWM